MEQQQQLIYQVIRNVDTLAESLQALSKSLKEAMGSEEKPAEPQTTAKVPSLEEVRGKLAELSMAGKTLQVKELIQSYGASRLSDIKPSDYTGIIEKAEVIANAK